MEKIIDTLKLNINEYIESKLCRYQNTETDNLILNIRDNMYNYSENIKKILDKNFISEDEYNLIKKIFHLFEKLKIFLEISNTKMYIGYESIITYLKSIKPGDNNRYIKIYTNRNIIISVYIGFHTFSSYEITARCDFLSTQKEDGDINLNIFIRMHNDSKEINIENIKNYIHIENSNILNHGIKINRYVEIIKKIMNNTEMHKIDLDYLLINDNNLSKRFMEKNQTIKLIEKEERIKELNNKIEEKSEKIEILNDEILKQKNNYKILEIEIKDNSKKYEIKINDLNDIIKEQKKKIENLIKDYNNKIELIKKDYQNENYNCTESLKEKILRLKNEINEKNLLNKKLNIQLNDLNELYENLQEKIVMGK
jgi:hypothetical protein